MRSSIQDKQQKDSIQGYLRQMLSMYYDNEFKLPEYEKDMRLRDEALMRIARTEKMLSSVLSTVVSRDKNRTWSLTGGVNLVSEYGKKLHSFENGSWRNFVSKASSNFYSTNLGYAVEIGTDLNGVPETAWVFDSKRVLLNYNASDGTQYPLVYVSKNGRDKIGLFYEEFLHGNSMPSSEEEFNDLGFCAIERSVVIGKILIGLFEYQLEKLGFAPPKGLMLLKGMERDEYEQAVADAEEEMKNANIEYYRGVLTLLTDNTQAGIDLVGFSQLPDQFNLQEFMDIVMQAYSLAFNYPVGQFWSIATGSFGRTGEMQIQEQQSTAKGELEFSLSIQEQLSNKFLPPSVRFNFDQRNDSGDLVRLEVEKQEIEKYISMYDTKNESILTRDEVRQIFAEKGFIPKEWAETVNDNVEQDLKEIRNSILSDGKLVSRIAKQPDEPIIMYRYDTADDLENKLKLNNRINWRIANYLGEYDFPKNGSIHVIFESGHDAIKKKIY